MAEELVLLSLYVLTANCIQRMRRTPPLDELQPPPYQDEDGSPRMSSTPSDLGDAKCGLSHASDSPRHSYGKCPSEGSGAQETESYLTKGYEEDVPSDSTAVLSPEVRPNATATPQMSLFLQIQHHFINYIYIINGVIDLFSM